MERAFRSSIYIFAAAVSLLAIIFMSSLGRSEDSDLGIPDYTKVSTPACQSVNDENQGPHAVSEPIHRGEDHGILVHQAAAGE